MLAAFFDLSSIASIGSAVALLVFTLITAGHLRVRRDTGANPVILTIAMLLTGSVLVTFAATTLVDEPATVALLVAIIALGALVDVLWKRRRAQAPAVG